MFEKSDLVPAEAASVGHVADGPVSTDTSSHTLSRQKSRLTAMMDDQPDEDYWYNLRVFCWSSPVSTDCLGMPQNALGCLHGLMSRQLPSAFSPHPDVTSKGLVMGCARLYCACHLRLCSFRLTVLQTDNAKHKAGCS